MSRRRNNSGRPGQRGAPMWVVTYGDLMSLLLTFFILLLSFSSITEEKFEQALESLRNALGIMPANLSIIHMEQDAQARRPAPRNIERMAREMQRRLQVLGREDDVDLEYEDGGLKISLPSQILFDSAQANVMPAAFPVLDSLADVFRDTPEAFIEVRGHTDNRPLLSAARFEDNYELSYARARSVTNYLNQAGEVPMEQFEIIAVGPSQPVATNETEEGRQQNRRVELYVRGDLDADTLEELQDQIGALEGGAQT